MYMYGHTLRTHKTFCRIVPLGGAIIEQNIKLPLTTMKFQINANSFLCILPIVIRLVLIDSLGHGENSDTNIAIVSQTSCPPF